METTTNRLDKGSNSQTVATAVHDDELADKGHALRAKLETAVEKAKAAYERLEDKTVIAAKAADKTVREHPYQAIGVAFGLGLLIGVLAMQRGRD
jgi:ElaB/YqjD/DUF883 family membrane-anchored ribosome-binding protein